MNILKTAEGWFGIGFAVLLGVGLLFVAGILALVRGLKALAITP